jgi:dipeptidyl aminopeptidase/acylaminoacyl peptidase
MKKLIVIFCLFASFSVSAQDDRKAFVDSLLNGIEVKKDIQYNIFGRPLLLDIYYPEKKSNETLPCVVWIHGGGLTDASLDKNYDLIRWGVAKTALKGFISVSVDYRLITERPLPTAMQDCLTAIRFLKSHAAEYGIDTTRIAVVGESAGGYLAGLCSFTCNTDIFSTNEWTQVSNHVACGVLWYPAINHSPYNMIDYISPDDIPVISIHGSNDGIVPIGQSYQIQKTCMEKGVDFKLYTIEDAEHGFFDKKWKFNAANRKYMEEAISITIEFLNKNLKK